MFLISRGTADVTIPIRDGRRSRLATFQQGTVFGEMALLGEWPRTATVRALDTVECLGIDRWVFLSQLERQPKVTIRMLQILAQRLRDSDSRLSITE